MVEWHNRALFVEQFIARVKMARQEHFSKLEMSVLLGLPLDIYEQYETHSLLPHYLIVRFCLVTGTDAFVLLGGHIDHPLSGDNGASL
jgi:hypothetical protein